MQEERCRISRAATERAELVQIPQSPQILDRLPVEDRLLGYRPAASIELILPSFRERPESGCNPRLLSSEVAKFQGVTAKIEQLDSVFLQRSDQMMPTERHRALIAERR